MSSLGVPPPAGMDRDLIAAWYLAEVEAAHEAGDRDTVADLIAGCIDAGVFYHLIPVKGFTKPRPLSSLLAPYRRDMAAEDAERSAWLADAHTKAVQGRRAERRWSVVAYVLVEWRQVGSPAEIVSFSETDDLDCARDQLARERARTAEIGRRDHFAIGTVVLDEDTSERET